MPDKDPRSEVIAKSLQDPAFRAALLKDPRAAVEKATGVKIPAGVTIKVVEDSSSSVHLVLPPAPAKGALSDADLGKVAGGFDVLQYTGATECIDNSHMTRPIC